MEINELFKAKVKEALIQILNDEKIEMLGSDISIEATNDHVSIKAPTKIVLEAPTVTLKTDALEVGDGASIDLLANASVWKTALETHVHPVTTAVTTAVTPAMVGTGAGTGSTGPPIAPLPQAQLTSTTGTTIKVKS